MSREQLVTSFPLAMETLGRQCVESAGRHWAAPVVYVDDTEGWHPDGARLTSAIPRWPTVRPQLEMENPAAAKPQNYVWRAQTFAVKPFVWLAAALTLQEGLLVWLDADCIVTRPVPETLVGEVLGRADVAYLGRGPMHPETGLVVFRVPQAIPLLRNGVDCYATGHYRHLSSGWTDCHVLREALLRTGAKAIDLTSARHGLDWNSSVNAMALSPFGPYVIHLKGGRAKRAEVTAVDAGIPS